METIQKKNLKWECSTVSDVSERGIYSLKKISRYRYKLISKSFAQSAHGNSRKCLTHYHCMSTVFKKGMEGRNGRTKWTSPFSLLEVYSLNGFMPANGAAHLYVVSLTHCIEKIESVSEEPA